MENEIILLGVLSGPTLIKFKESFNERGKKYIVMEYAEGGNLDQKIKKIQRDGKRLTYD